MKSLELKVPPVALVIAVGGLMWLAAKVMPSLSFSYAGQSVVAAGLAVIGVIVAAAGVVEFRHAHTTVDPTKPEKSSALVASGIYRISRNPMYVGFLLLLGAWAAYLGNALALAGLPIFVGYMNRWQITPEERALREKFGDAFSAYERSVRRWL